MFGEGLITGTADHFNETVTIEQSKCLHRGDDKCVYECSFEKVTRDEDNRQKQNA